MESFENFARGFAERVLPGIATVGAFAVLYAIPYYFGPTAWWSPGYYFLLTTLLVAATTAITLIFFRRLVRRKKTGLSVTAAVACALPAIVGYQGTPELFLMNADSQVDQEGNLELSGLYSWPLSVDDQKELKIALTRTSPTAYVRIPRDGVGVLLTFDTGSTHKKARLALNRAVFNPLNNTVRPRTTYNSIAPSFPLHAREFGTENASQLVEVLPREVNHDTSPFTKSIPLDTVVYLNKEIDDEDLPGGLEIPEGPGPENYPIKTDFPGLEHLVSQWITLRADRQATATRLFDDSGTFLLFHFHSIEEDEPQEPAAITALNLAFDTSEKQAIFLRLRYRPCDSRVGYFVLGIGILVGLLVYRWLSRHY